MAIAGIGVDVVDLARFERAVSRTPRLRERLFAESELTVGDRDRPLRSLAGRFAAKEALMKALGDTTGIGWHDMAVVSDAEGNPSFEVSGAAAAIMSRRGIVTLHLSMSHDAGVAVAQVVAETA
jgi:holo-[acyl-carrier protein] synthase